jgi:hypothetical protein
VEPVFLNLRVLHATLGLRVLSPSEPWHTQMMRYLVINTIIMIIIMIIIIIIIIIRGLFGAATEDFVHVTDE